jgi:succinate dehydrogenase hydrophobic anchor subunit
MERGTSTSKLPGAGTASALLLVFVLGVWLGILGPLNLEGLQRWQTLAASFVAVIAAAIAYFAAMAKVKLDKRLADSQILRQTLATFLKLEFAIQVLRHEARGLQKKIEDVRLPTVKTSDLAIFEPKEMLEAWERLDLFPAK